MLIKSFPALLVNRKGRQTVSDDVVCEAAYRFYINQTLITTVNVSPVDLENYAIGRAVTDGLLHFEEIEEVIISGTEIYVQSKAGAAVSGEPSPEIRRISSRLAISEKQVRSCAGFLPAFGGNWQRTGGLHIAALFDRHIETIRAAEDIGRHNAVDKVVGYALREGHDLSASVILCSGRQPEDMVAKIARTGIPIVISRAATTDRGIALADRVGLTLIGFAREDRFTIYTHAERITQG